MNVGDLLLAIGTVACVAGASLSYWSLRDDRRQFRITSRALLAVPFLSITACLLYLASLFLSSDLSYSYVWSRVSPDMSSLYKVSAIWSGGEGALLLWLWFMSLVLVILLLVERRQANMGQRFHSWAQMAVAAVAAVFCLASMQLGLFERTTAVQLTLYPDGFGMNPVLLTPEMVIHPPVIFAAYAACLGLFAVVLAHLATGEKGWNALAMTWARSAWLLLTSGIAVGAVWAYYVTGWGGYWYWDPVETVSLVPWLLVTAFLHSASRHVTKGENPVLAPFLGMLSFVSVVFAAFVTRTGGLWGSSVHTYGASEGSGIGERLLTLLSSDSTVLGLFSVMVVLATVTAYLSFARWKTLGEHPRYPSPKRLSELIGDRNNATLAVLLMLTTALTLVAIMVKNTDVAPYLNDVEFNQKVSVFCVSIMVVLCVCSVWRMFGTEKTLYFAIGLASLSVALGALAVITGFADPLVAFTVPSCISAIGASLLGAARTPRRPRLRSMVYRMTPHVIHLGVALILLSYVVSTQLQSTPVQGEWSAVAVDGELCVGDYCVRLVSLSSYEVSGAVDGYTVTTLAEAMVSIERSDGATWGPVVLGNVYGGSGVTSSSEVLEAEVYVLSAVSEDLYVSFDWTNDRSAMLHVKTVPMMSGLWAGVVIVCAGAAVRTVSWEPGRIRTQ